ncbi:competence protein ComER [Alkalihalobacillus alcalophilus ATCC 27647 = CGMCC 1.3604]|uniref:Pyrroline-5-carboxylate reductase n=1 Tax=Alkalihalobacillus alcalophilus ATCC 27647 = CGMCC 1.3604 TaxID=1218173 RepID=A0A094YY52_ALKAL|nr:late competence protein ComER [Alkalihalobacillus alcalophilus]KGA98467.1 competence protein [Alkalihalobacillus alcalophilus ATCC 27647 = CGMCC 1.3604]MED1563349.1 late competence protein ComER [Alkalihalobacillus alcalophilus]THG88536.1 competence protein ComER [Alkalihalobacillus alcalophilus ATCC 27647 = CGMCC 1.3604]
MKIGVIGTGSMGTILIESWLDTEIICPEQLIIYNRTSEKAERIQRQFPSIHLAENPTQVVQQADITFLCVKPPQFPNVIHEIQPVVARNDLFVSITSPISVIQLEEQLNCKVARVIPSILNRVHAGSTLLSFGTRCTETDKKTLTDLMKTISEPLLIDENITRVSSDIVSCGPAFFSYLLQEFINASVRQTEISEEEATILATNMLVGMGKLLEKRHYSLSTLQERVCVPGGITGEGLKVLDNELGPIFDHLFQKTHKKYDDERSKLKFLFKA